MTATKGARSPEPETADVADAAKWTALAQALAEVRRLLAGRPDLWPAPWPGQEPVAAPDGRADVGADPHRAGRDRTSAPQPGRSADAAGPVRTGRTSPFEDD